MSFLPRPSRLERVGRFRQFSGVNLSNYQKMDPHLLVGLLNTDLRNQCESLDDLVKTHSLDSEVLVAKMAAAGYIYQPEINQFR